MATVRSNRAVTRGLLDQKDVDMLVDSGSSISLMQESVATAFSRTIEKSPKGLQLISAAFKKTRICAVETYDEPAGEAIDSCAIPLFGKATLPTYDVPNCTNKLLLAVLEQHKDLFSTTPGHTELAEHFIPTTGTPVKIPPRRIPANCRAEVEEQIQTMLKEGIIEESSSPWMSPAVFV